MGLETAIDLRALRLNRGLSQEALADEIGIPRRVWQRAEVGLGIRPKHALQVAEFFGCKVTDIWPT